MKKILFATTALVATAGVAAADVTFSGSSRFGVIYSETAAVAAVAGTGTAAQIAAAAAASTAAAAASTAADTALAAAIAAGTVAAADYAAADAAATAATNSASALAAISGSAAVAKSDSLDITNRFTLNIDGTAETDSGATFHARVRIRGGNTGSTSLSNTSVSAPQVGVSAGGFRLNVGNIWGALESTPGLYGGAVGLTGLGWGNLATNTDTVGYWGWDSFSSGGSGSNGVEVLYSAGAFGAHLSHSPSSDLTAVHGSYGFGNWTVAVGYQDGGSVSSNNKLLGTVGGSFGAVGVGLAVADNDGTTKFVLNGSFGIGASSKITAYVGSEDGAGENYGIGFTHGLGGATLAGGIVSNTDDTIGADLGVRFNF